jgi:dipeptidyl aminopeptidase/acylaminoacyl peptidase
MSILPERGGTVASAGAFLSLHVIRLPRLSLDGRRLAYVDQKADLAGDRYVSDVRVLDLAGGPPGGFTFSGAVLVLAWDRHGTGLLVGLDDTLWHLPQAPDLAPRPVWVADGVITDVDPHPAEDRFLVSVAPSRRPAETATRVVTLRYKADGRGVLPAEPDGVWEVTLGPEGGATARRLGQEPGGYRQGRWSPDGRQAMALWAAADEELPSRHRLARLATGGEPERAITEPLDIATFAWQPEGQGVVLMFQDGPYGSAAPFTLAAVDLEGTMTRWPTAGAHLGLGPLTDWRWPSAQPRLGVEGDGQAALATVLTEASVEVWRFGAEREPAPVIAGPAAVGDFSADREMTRIAFTRSTPVSPDEVHLWQRADGKTVALTDANRAWTARLRPRLPQEFTLTAEDGGRVPCWWLAPPDAAPPYPTVLIVHGGPHGAFGRNLLIEHQLLAQAGIAVLWVNPRGSTGYGEAFARQVVERWGEEDRADLMLAVDRACAEWGADPSRLAIMGTSYGGFMASWTIGHTDRFRTAVIQAPVIDQVSMYGTSDIGHYFIPLQVGADPASDVMRLWERSPLRYAPRVTASVLLICGEADDRCPIGQTEEYFTALRRTGVRSEFLRYPNEAHGFSAAGTPTHRLHRQQAILDWLRRELA